MHAVGINLYSYVNRTEHKQYCPNCPFLKIKDPYNITVGDILQLEKAAVENFFVSTLYTHHIITDLTLTYNISLDTQVY